MVKQSFMKFTCDTCGEYIYEDEKDGFLFEKGWIFIHGLTGEVGYQKKEVIGFELKDKHYCKNECFFSAVGNSVEKSRSNEATSVVRGSIPLEDDPFG